MPTNPGNPAGDMAVVKSAVLAIKEDMSSIKSVLCKFDDRLRILEMNQASIQAKVGIFTLIASSIGIIAAAIAAYLGTR